MINLLKKLAYQASTRCNFDQKASHLIESAVYQAEKGYLVPKLTNLGQTLFFLEEEDGVRNRGYIHITPELFGMSGCIDDHHWTKKNISWEAYNDLAKFCEGFVDLPLKSRLLLK